MTQVAVTVTVNGRDYTVACREGEEERIQTLAAHLDRHVRENAPEDKSASDIQLLLIASLMIADELLDLRERHKELSDKRNEGNARAGGAGAVEAVNEASQRIEALAERIERIVSGS